MKVRTRGLALLVLVLFVSAILAVSAVAQSSTGSIRGKVSDPTGAMVPQAALSATDALGKNFSATSKADGGYEIKDLAPGKYIVRATAKGFAQFEQADVQVVAGQASTFDIALSIEVQKQEVNVEDEAARVNVDPSSNAGAIVIKGKDLDALSDDPDQLQADLDALAGPAAGPNGGQMYIDGFSNGQLPPKSAIREIRINQNPFSAEYDHIGFARIEIFTKPGQDKFRGSFMTNLNNAVFNSRNPFVPATENPGYHSQQFNGNFSGPISKNSSFFFNLERRDVNDSSVVSPWVLDPNFNIINSPQAVLHPITRMSIGPRVDYQLTKNDTLTARYHYTTMSSDNNLDSIYSLPSSQTSNTSRTSQELQISETHLITNYTVNETRFEYERERSSAGVTSFAPTISVQNAFVGGGNSSGFSTTHDDNIELQNLTMQTRGTHMLKWGGRLRFDRQALDSNSEFNGTFSFANINAYQLVQRGLAQGLTTAQIRAACVAGLGPNPTENQLLNCGPDQFSLTAGIPTISLSQADLGVYFADDWKVRPNFTLSYGLRFETQNNIQDHTDFAPRLAFAWGLGRKKAVPKTILRAGIGMFYDRFRMSNILATEQQNGVRQQRFVVQPTPVNPNAYPDFYPLIPSLAQLQAYPQSQSVYALAPNLRTPYMIQSAVIVERQITKTSTVAVNYVNSRGLHQLTTLNVNAPLNGVLPDPNSGPIYQYADVGIFKQQQVMIIPRIQFSSRISLFSFYTLSWANSTPGSPSNPYNLMTDYGRSVMDQRQRFMIMGTISLPWNLRLNPNINASSGRPWNIVIGQDLNGDSFRNDRPSFAQPGDPNVAATKWGTFNLTPTPGEKLIPINYATGPAQFTMGMRISKTFVIGKRTEVARGGQQGGGPGGPGGPGGDRVMMGGGPHGPGDHGPGGGGGPRGGGGFGGPMIFGGGGRGGAANGRYSLTISAEARNLLNNVNYGTPVSSLNSPLFGTYYSIVGGGGPGGFGGTPVANRRIMLQAMLSF